MPLALIYVSGCGGVDTPVGGAGTSTGAGTTSLGTVSTSMEVTSTSTSEASTGGELECSWSVESSPRVVAQLSLGDARIMRAVASPNGDFYLVGLEHSQEDADATLWKVSADGERLWTARWGNALGWSDYAHDVLALPDSIVITGTAGRYEDQEYSTQGHSFVRAYSHGGVVRWTWEDVEGLVPTSNVRRPKMLVPNGADLLLVSRVYVEDGDDHLQVVTLTTEGEVSSRWTHPKPGLVLAARVDDDGDVWVALSSGDPWLGHWRADGTFVESLTAGAANVATEVAAFGLDGSVAIAGERTRSSGGQLVVTRLGPRLENPQLAVFETTEREYRGYSLDVALDCAGVAWVAVEGQVYPLGGFDDRASHLWTVDGLETVAVSDQGVAITAGYDLDSETTVVRWLRGDS